MHACLNSLSALHTHTHTHTHTLSHAFARTKSGLQLWHQAEEDIKHLAGVCFTVRPRLSRRTAEDEPQVIRACCPNRGRPDGDKHVQPTNKTHGSILSHVPARNTHTHTHTLPAANSHRHTHHTHDLFNHVCNVLSITYCTDYLSYTLSLSLSLSLSHTHTHTHHRCVNTHVGVYYWWASTR